MDNQQGPTYYIAQGTLRNIMWQPKWEKDFKKNRYMYNWISFCTPETNTMLLITYVVI